jgi:hypothetical protein
MLQLQLFGAPLAADTGPGPQGLGTVVVSWAAGCEPLFTLSLAADTGQGQRTVVMGQGCGLGYWM